MSVTPFDSPPPDIGTSGAPKTTPLGNGYSLVTWTIKVFDPVTGTMVDKEQSQIVPDKDAASVAAVEAAKVAAGAAGTSARITTEGANQRAAAENEITRAQNAATNAHNAAVQALAEGNAAEARRQFEISSSETQRWHNMDADLRQQSQDLEKSKFGKDVYDKLADLASNPRNYMEQFFRFRGSPVPEGAGAYGNGGQQGIVPFEQFLPNFLHSTFGASSSSGAGAAGTTSSANPRAGGALNPALFGSPANPNPMPTPVKAGPVITSRDSSGNVAPPSTYYQSDASAPYGIAGQGAPGQQFRGVQGTPIAFNEHADAPIVGAPGGLDQVRQPKQFADGGTLRMTAPHAIVNLLTGRVAAIAGEQPGSGPQGFVPETAKFDGQAIIRDEGEVYETTPNPGDPTLAQDPVAPVPADSPPPDIGTYQPPFSVLPAGEGFSAPASPLPIPGVVPTSAETVIGHDNVYQPAPTVEPFERPDIAPLPPYVPPTTTALTTTTAPTVPQATTPIDRMPPPTPALVNPQIETPEAVAPGVVAPPAATPPVAPTAVPPTTPTATAPATSVSPPVTASPPTTTSATPPANPPAPTPSFLGQLAALAQTPSGLGKNPSFLPEDAAAVNPIVRSLIQNNAFPPFLQRIFAQQAGLAGLGTNVPQQTNLPPGVPLTSRLALNQLSPSELSAFQSFISANGIDWNDYLALVDQSSPQGGAAKLTATPRYLAQ